MVLIATATCKDAHELNNLRAKLQKITIRPEIYGQNVHIEYESGPSATPFEIDSMTKIISEAFGSVETHGISIMP